MFKFIQIIYSSTTLFLFTAIYVNVNYLPLKLSNLLKFFHFLISVRRVKNSFSDVKHENRGPNNLYTIFSKSFQEMRLDKFCIQRTFY